MPARGRQSVRRAVAVDRWGGCCAISSTATSNAWRCCILAAAQECGRRPAGRSLSRKP